MLSVIQSPCAQFVPFGTMHLHYEASAISFAGEHSERRGIREWLGARWTPRRTCALVGRNRRGGWGNTVRPALFMVIFLLAGFAPTALCEASLRPTSLRCEYLVGPLAVDAARPRLSWVLDSDRRGAAQSAYRILVASTKRLLDREQGDLWDSGKVASNQTAHIEYAGAPPAPGAECWWKVRVWDAAGAASPWSDRATWRTGLRENGNWSAQWIAWPDEVTERQPPIVFRGVFATHGKIERATAYASALGVYELWINGDRVGDRVLAPEWTDYHVRVQYQAFDVTDAIKKGRNAVGAMVGDGWYAGRIGLAEIVKDGPKWGIYGRNPKFVLQIGIEYADGTRERIVTDATWKCTKDGPVRASDILDGETQDARIAIRGWSGTGFDDAAWRPVATAPVTNAPLLVAQPNEPVRVVDELKPISLTEPTPGVFVYDLGQNMVGWCRFTANARAGATARFRYGEALNPDGTLYTANLRGAPQTDTYTFATDRKETFEPHFTYHGFRYVEVTGLAAKPPINALTGRVFCSSPPETGAFECSNAMLDQLAQNIRWTQRANMMSVPTDCPQRDERLGWMGDIQVFAQTAMFNMDMAAFLTKWLQDVRDDQAADGRFPDFVPHPFDPNARFSGVPAWGDAGTIVPWRMYENYGDTRILDRHYDAARRWIEYVRALNPDLVWNKGRNNDYNDWLNGDTLKIDNWPKTGGA
ncbi:MAG: alfa-L-rhamnosidase, partial [Candidatus Hydrogenedentes bacterium]|nr:alfa-L-rhamnosidase [Candidatus Hydrogenedentota bacterium]